MRVKGKILSSEEGSNSNSLDPTTKHKFHKGPANNEEHTTIDASKADKADDITHNIHIEMVSEIKEDILKTFENEGKALRTLRERKEKEAGPDTNDSNKEHSNKSITSCPRIHSKCLYMNS